MIQFKRWTRNNDGTTGVVHPLAKQILTEASLLALEHIREGLKRTVTRTSDSATVTTVIEERIDSFLKHALLIVDDYVRSLKRQEVLQTVVTIDDTTVKVVQIGGRETATFKWDERTKVWWNDRKHFKHHPLWARA